jgi:hypothetical protein
MPEKIVSINKLKSQGFIKILEIQRDYNERIKNAPKKGQYSKMTGGYSTSQYEYRQMKFDAIKDVCQDLAVFGITLLSQESLAELKPKTTSMVDEVRDLLE